VLSQLGEALQKIGWGFPKLGRYILRRVYKVKSDQYSVILKDSPFDYWIL